MNKFTQFNNRPETSHGRRDFLKVGSAVAGAALAGVATARSAEAKEDERPLKLGLVGCGGRGTGAANDSLTINEGVQLVAVADIQMGKCQSAAKGLANRHKAKVDVPAERMYDGLDGYKKILDDKEVDVVLFATPPGFRPYHVSDAVAAGKHIFSEKPVLVDPAGYRVCVKAHEAAEANGTAIVTGTQYRRQTNYIEAVQQIRDGAIGDIVSATTRYCSGGIWYRGRSKDVSDTQYQLNNWMHFIWLSGDQICEQAIHNIDAINWVMGGAPETAYGSGGRFRRPADSEMWDSMCIDFKYPGDRLLSFMCRQLGGTKGANGNFIYGTEGTCHIPAMSGTSTITDHKGQTTWSAKGSIGDAYKQEHKDLIDSIRSGKPIVELRQTAESSLTAVMGRLAAYTGQEVTWDFVTSKSTLDTMPKNLAIDDSRPEPSFAVPGVTKLV